MYNEAKGSIQIGTVGNLSLQVFQDNFSPYFCVIGKDSKIKTRFLIPSQVGDKLSEVLDFPQLDSVTEEERAEISSWLGEPNSKEPNLTNFQALKFSWNILNPNEEIK